VTIAGFDEVGIGETIAAADNPIALPYVSIDEPTISMNFIVNTSPFAGREGKLVTSRNIRERLKGTSHQCSLRVEEPSRGLQCLRPGRTAPSPSS
jgi:GTP-binding protein